MHYIWNGEWPENKTPRIADFVLDDKRALDNVTLIAGESYSAAVSIEDDEKDPINYTWEILPESTDLKEGGDHETRPSAVTGLFTQQDGNVLTFNAPEKGAYRLFVYANDGHEHAATANIPFYVN